MSTIRRTSRKAAPATMCLALLVAASAGSAHELLSDEQLDAITAGADETRLEEIVVHATRLTASGKRVTADGTVGVQHSPRALDAAELLLRDSAQSNLQALVNLNAVHSVVNVLVNLNINIDSQVGELRQINLAMPASPPAD